jgi:hypothetical protein
MTYYYVVSGVNGIGESANSDQAGVTLSSGGGNINIDDYGALGNGTTNDGPAIQNCLNANPGRTIIFTSSKNYRADSLTVSEGTIISGYGSKISARSDNNIFIMSKNAQIKGLEIVGNNFTNGFDCDEDNHNTRACGVYAVDVNGVVVQDCNIHNIGFTGVFLFGGCSNCLITNNVIKYFGYCGIQLRCFGWTGIKQDAANDIISYNNIELNCDNSVTGSEFGIFLWGFDGDNPLNKHIMNISVDHNTVLDHTTTYSNCIWASSGRYIHFTNNTVTESDGFGTDYTIGMEACWESEFIHNIVTNGYPCGIAVYNFKGDGTGACQDMIVRDNLVTYTPVANIDITVLPIGCIRDCWGNNGTVTLSGNTYHINNPNVQQTVGFDHSPVSSPGYKKTPGYIYTPPAF